MTKIQQFFIFWYCFIRATIKTYIVNPILRWYNFYFKHIYIPANKRNTEMLDYFIRVAENPNTQPETPTEIFFENMISKDFIETFTHDDGTFFQEEDWLRERQMIYMDMAQEMLTYRWIDDTDL